MRILVPRKKRVGIGVGGDDSESTSSRAPAPRKYVNLVPETAEPASKSMSPSAAPSCRWSFTSKSIRLRALTVCGIRFVFQTDRKVHEPQRRAQLADGPSPRSPCAGIRAPRTVARHMMFTRVVLEEQ